MNEVPPKVRQKLLGFTLDYQQEQIIRIIHIRFFILLFHTGPMEQREQSETCFNSAESTEERLRVGERSSGMDKVKAQKTQK